VLLGPPGAGKGTQADRIAARFQLVHLATGDILRANVADGTPMGEVAQAYLDSGELVPDEVVVAMMLERLTQPDCGHGFLLDGFPRSVAQARALDEHLAELGTPLDAAINLEVAEEELLHRLAGRGRADDNAQTIRNRLQVFVSATRPLLDYYDEQGLLFSVAAAGTIDEVSERILHAPRDVPRPAPPAPSQPATSGSQGADAS
jgi:adenylate kinase